MSSEVGGAPGELDLFHHAPATYIDTPDGYTTAEITVGEVTVRGVAADAELAHKAALYAAEQVIARTHPDHQIRRPYPDSFVDDQGTQWQRVDGADLKYGTYRFRLPDTEDEDITDEQTMFLWGVRVQEE